MSSYPILYRGSVKDLRGPIEVNSKANVIFEYTDAYSVFDWGRMPDMLPKKGDSLATLACDWFERLDRADTWKDFSKTNEALALRKANRFGSIFNELGESLQKTGLRTHYTGALPSDVKDPRPLSDVKQPVRQFVVKQVSAVRPAQYSVLGRSLPDYLPTRNSPPPRLVPLEVIFRFSCPSGSSLLERVAKDPGYMASIGFGHLQVGAGQKWDFPVLELFTKLETTDRPISLTEALAISGLSAPQLQDVLLKTAWTAGWLKWVCAKAGLELADGKLEWGVSESGEIFLVDAIGPDELRILKDGIQLSKEFLRTFYRTTPWYEAINQAKQQAKTQGIAEWKKLVAEGPPNLPASQKELAGHLYQSLTNELTGKKWFPEAWPLDRVMEELRKI